MIFIPGRGGDDHGLIKNSGVAIANAVVTSSPLAVAGPATPAGHPMAAMRDAIPAAKRRAAAATVASVNRGTT